MGLLIRSIEIPKSGSEEEKKTLNNQNSLTMEGVSPIPVIRLVPQLECLSSTFWQEDVRLKTFAEFFGRAFSGSCATQSLRVKMLGESGVTEIADWPVCYIDEDVYNTSVDWISQFSSLTDLKKFVFWSMDCIFAYMEMLQSEEGDQQPMSDESLAGIFLVLAMVLRRKPDSMLNILPKLGENSAYEGVEKHRIVIWMITQACHGDLATGLLMWTYYLLPLLSEKSGSSPLLRDMVLQLAERIVATPRARDILVGNAVKKWARVIPPTSLDLLLHLKFPASPARVEETERLEKIYQTLKDVALAGDRQSSLMNQATQQIQIIAIKAVVEDNF